MNRTQCAPTREICVCWDMTSATRIAHGSPAARIARLRARSEYQSSRATEIAVAVDGADIARLPSPTTADGGDGGYPCLRSTDGKGSP
jgi:hypothetical protein